MKAADLDKASSLAAARVQNLAMRDRLAAGEPLVLSIGEGGKTSQIVMSSGWLADVRRDLVAAFNLRISENDAALSAMGVEIDG
ncbi:MULTISPECIES: hypothetical protein [unclassified Mesorhizobium]|uniref:hypothetical protein n=1 Tax=unclassified Mesorhizobium TaxID=325217 RepID=UPI00112D4ABF|nr:MULTISPECIES: hypothetical protein [unclassified Mesorhizobium]MCA0025492.1 hypothetical protein [Mesorhizobium sp. B263B1A]TPJ97122.1 hypothetical protein FJ489_11825 [Mesorhizobium sp. B2-5-12]TPK27212.1 hypothetical protein FJ562_08200 [Mesorhizobium sp. B2-5-6]